MVTIYLLDFSSYCFMFCQGNFFYNIKATDVKLHRRIDIILKKEVQSTKSGILLFYMFCVTFLSLFKYFILFWPLLVKCHFSWKMIPLTVKYLWGDTPDSPSSSYTLFLSWHFFLYYINKSFWLWINLMIDIIERKCSAQELLLCIS